MRLGLTAFDAPMLDHTAAELDSATRIVYRIDQRFRYTYDAPIRSLSQRLIAVPRPRHGELYRRAHQVRVAGTRSRRRTSYDAAGNTVVRVTAERVEHSVEFRIAAVLEWVRRTGHIRLPARTLDDPALRQHTRLTAPDDRLRELAANLLRPGGKPLDVAERICTAVFASVAYERGVTGVATTAAEALTAGRGVCQDSAHIMVALARLAQLPARYVSGHLLGQGGTHAWVEVVVPHRGAAEAVPFDPCHGRRTDHRYLTVAVGRDYADVAPTSGTFVGRPGGELTTARSVGVISAG